jgi:hypothetical protein
MTAHPTFPSDPADLAHDARNALASVMGRIQLLGRQAERGQIDPDHLRTVLSEAQTHLRRAVALVDAIEDAAETPQPVRLARRSAA